MRWSCHDFEKRRLVIPKDKMVNMYEYEKLGVRGTQHWVLQLMILRVFDQAIYGT
jgi:hypothetical protein